MPDFGIFRGFNDKLFGDKLYAGQLPTQLGLIGSLSLFDPDALAFFDRVTIAGGTLSATEKLAIDTLVKQMKSYGIWTKMKAIYPFVGASAAACAQNLKSSSFTGTFNGGWTFASTGAKPNGTTGYMNTGILPTTQLSISSAHLSQYVNTNINLAVIMGNNDLSCFLQPQTTIIYGGLASTNFISGNTTNNQSGFYLVNRPASNSLKIIKNNSILNTATTTGTAYSSGQNIYIGAYSASANFSNARIAFSSIGDGLTDTEASDFYTAVQAFQTTLSRNV